MRTWKQRLPMPELQAEADCHPCTELRQQSVLEATLLVHRYNTLWSMHSSNILSNLWTFTLVLSALMQQFWVGNADLAPNSTSTDSSHLAPPDFGLTLCLDTRKPFLIFIQASINPEASLISCDNTGWVPRMPHAVILDPVWGVLISREGDKLTSSFTTRAPITVKPCCHASHLAGCLCTWHWPSCH